MKRPSRAAPFVKRRRYELLIRFYRWAADDTLAQFRAGFPRLQGLKSGPALKYLEFIGTLPRADQKTFLLARLKQAHAEAISLIGESISESEKVLLDVFYRGHEVQIPHTPLKAYYSSSAEMLLNDMRLVSPAAFRINKPLLLSRIKAKLTPFLGEAERSKGLPQGLAFQTEIGGGLLSTVVETPRFFQLRYSQGVSLNRRPVVIERTSAFRWMGVHVETSWNYLTESDMDPTAGAVESMCKTLFGAIPSLLKGLSP